MSRPVQLPVPRGALRRAQDGYGSNGRPAWTEIDWRAHLNFAEVAGKRVNYVDFGADNGEPPLLFIHGIAGRWTHWLENIPHFAQSRRVIAVDLPGFGDSEMPSDGITIPGYGRCIESFCDQLELESVQIAGSSMGGFVGAEMAIQYPQRVERLVLVSAVGASDVLLKIAPLLGTVALLERMSARHVVTFRKKLLRRPRLRKIGLSLIANHGDRLSPEMAYELSLGVNKEGFVDAFKAMTKYDIRDRLSKIGCPVLVVWGADDPLVPIGDAYLFENAIPGARLEIIRDASHLSMLERPDQFNRIVEQFLDEPITGM